MDEYYQLLQGSIITYINDISFTEHVDTEQQYETFRNQYQIEENLSNFDITELQKEQFYHNLSPFRQPRHASCVSKVDGQYDDTGSRRGAITAKTCAQ